MKYLMKDEAIRYELRKWKTMIFEGLTLEDDFFEKHNFSEINRPIKNNFCCEYAFQNYKRAGGNLEKFSSKCCEYCPLISLFHENTSCLSDMLSPYSEYYATISVIDDLKANNPNFDTKLAQKMLIRDMNHIILLLKEAG